MHDKLRNRRLLALLGCFLLSSSTALPYSAWGNDLLEDAPVLSEAWLIAAIQTETLDLQAATEAQLQDPNAPTPNGSDLYELHRLLAGVRLAPGMEKRSLDELDLRLAEAQAHASDPDQTGPNEEAMAAANASVWIGRYRRALRDEMIDPGSAALQLLVQEDLNTEFGEHGLSWRADRVTRVLPLLKGDTATQAREMFGDAIVAAASEGASASVELRERLEADANSEALADLQEAGELQTISDSRAAAMDAALTDLESRREKSLEIADAALQLPPLDPTRRESIDNAWFELRDTVEAHYGLIAQLEEENRELRDEIRDQQAPGPDATDDELMALQRLSDARVAERDRVHVQIDRAYESLYQARSARRSLTQYASGAAQTTAQRSFIPELQREIASIPGELASMGRTVEHTPSAAWSSVTDVTAAWTLVRRAMLTALVFIIWLGIRRRTTKAAVRLAENLVKKSTIRPDDPKEFEASVVRTFLPIADLAVAGFLTYRLSELAPSLGVFSAIWMAIIVSRLGKRVPALLLSSPSNATPTKFQVKDRTRKLAISTTSWFADWWAVFGVLNYAAVQAIGADRLADVVRFSGRAIFWALALIFVTRWGPIMRDRVKRRGVGGRLGRWAASGKRRSSFIGNLVNLPRALASLLLLTWERIHALISHLAEGRASLAWLQTALALQQVQTEPEEIELPPIDAETREALDLRHSLDIDRPKAFERLDKAFAAYTEEERRGMVSLIGARGSGLREIVDALPDRWETGERKWTRMKVFNRLRSPESVRRWLARKLGSDGAPTQEELLKLLDSAPPTVFVIEDAHMLFQRIVGGYDPLKECVEIMTASSERHFWVITFHQPTWKYLQGMGAQLKLDAFRDHVELKPLTASELREWLEGRAKRIELFPDYTPLVASDLQGSDRRAALHRAGSAYWRLIADASLGNPAMALDLWLDSLSPGEDKRVLTRMFNAPDAKSLQSLGDEPLLVLTALLQHDVATADTLSHALNEPSSDTAAACRHLVSLGLVSFDRARKSYQLSERWRPAIRRLLRQKHFAHWEA